MQEIFIEVVASKNKNKKVEPEVMKEFQDQFLMFGIVITKTFIGLSSDLSERKGLGFLATVSKDRVIENLNGIISLMENRGIVVDIYKIEYTGRIGLVPDKIV